MNTPSADIAPPSPPAGTGRRPDAILLVLCLVSIGFSAAAFWYCRSHTAPGGGTDLNARIQALENQVAGLQRQLAASAAAPVVAAVPPTAAGIAAANPTGANPAPAGLPGPYAIVVNAGLTGTLGRIVVNFPADAGGTQTKVFPPGGADATAGKYGQATFELLPGSCDAEVGGRRISGVPIQSGHDTRIKAGILRVKGSSGTQFAVLEAGAKDPIQKAYGSHDFGLPAGAYEVMVSGQRAPVTVADGQITEF